MVEVVEVAGFEDLVEVGRGGFSVVYRARQLTVGRTVALKVLSRIDLDDAAFARFEQECQAMGALSWHPHVVVVFDAGRTEMSTPYLAMELVEGGSYADRVERDGPLEWHEVLKVGVQVADALAAAHELGVLHRDVKPENVLVDRFGNARLTDFGIATVQGGARTATGIVTGTLAHTAPELLAGERASVASDVYGLGSTLYQLLAGSPAFVHDTDENQLPILRRTMDDPIPDLRVRGVPDAVATVVERTMAKHAQHRPVDAYDLARRLQQTQIDSGQAPTRIHSSAPAGTDAAPADSTDPVDPAPTNPTQIITRPGRSTPPTTTRTDPTVDPDPTGGPDRGTTRPQPAASGVLSAAVPAGTNRRSTVLAVAVVAVAIAAIVSIALLATRDNHTTTVAAEAATTSTTRRATTSTTRPPTTTTTRPPTTTTSTPPTTVAAVSLESAVQAWLVDEDAGPYTGRCPSPAGSGASGSMCSGPPRAVSEGTVIPIAPADGFEYLLWLLLDSGAGGYAVIDSYVFDEADDTRPAPGWFVRALEVGP